jgi:hypothetical protein
MPIAVVLNTQEKFELKTLEGAFVVVRRMNYGESLRRQGMATKFFIDGSQNSKDFKGELDVQQEAVTLWDFANLVVEHNLTDENERTLNFKSAHDVKRLDGAIGQEIGKYIDDFNRFEGDDEVKNS